MARINRSDIIQKAVNDLAISQSGEKIPNETLDKVQLTYNLNRKFSSFVTGTSTGTSGTLSLTLPSVSAGGEIYLTGIQASYSKDASCDLGTGTIPVLLTPDSGVSSRILQFATITLTAQSESLAYSFPYPIKVKPGIAVTVLATFSLGNLQRSVNVMGFTTSSN